ncbi:hypothetical protein AB0H71_13830 [Nocardia sp. NPDC050697]|uniref:hypothetical protein n=1 Tax=Nocardia sp. NPDC050697 TaxID=3155158 RepID=UPI0033F4A1DF
MARMLGAAAWDGLFCHCCDPRRSHHHQRQREAQEWRREIETQLRPPEETSVVTLSDWQVAEHFAFTEAEGRDDGWHEAYCFDCSAETSGYESTVEDWAYEHYRECDKRENEALRMSAAAVMADGPLIGV